MYWSTMGCTVEVFSSFIGTARTGLTKLGEEQSALEVLYETIFGINCTNQNQFISFLKGKKRIRVH